MALNGSEGLQNWQFTIFDMYTINQQKTLFYRYAKRFIKFAASLRVWSDSTHCFRIFFMVFEHYL